MVVMLGSGLAPLTASGQGMYLERNQSGAGLEGIYLDGEGRAAAYSFSIGYSFRGLASPWVSIQRSEGDDDHVLRVYEVGIDHHPLKTVSDFALQPVLNASFGVIDPMPGERDDFWSLGAGAYAILRLDPGVAVYPAANVTSTWIEGDPYTVYSASLSLAFKTGSNPKSYVRAHYVLDDDVDFFGIALGFVSNR